MVKGEQMQIKTRFKGLFRKVFYERTEKLKQEMKNSQVSQKLLKLHYQTNLSQKLPLPKISEAGWRVFSQTDEDGILHYIFSLIGTTNKVCLDIAFASPYTANTTNLILNNGWTGLLICGNDKEVKSAKEFFKLHPDTAVFPPVITHKWITAENVNETVKEGLSQLYIDVGRIDLFSLDIDGVDYWIWKALEVVKPRVIVAEYQDIWGEKSVTIPYKPDFCRYNIHPDYCSASLPALVKLAKEKGYRLVGCNRLGYNAFFIKKGIGENIFPEITVKECLVHPKVISGQKNRLPAVKKYKWVEI